MASPVTAHPKSSQPSAGVFVHSVATGVGTANDVASSYWGNLNDQVRLDAHRCPQSSSRLFCCAHRVGS